MKMNEKLKLQIPTRGSAPGPYAGGYAPKEPRPPFGLANRDPRARHDRPFGQILDQPLHVGSLSEVPEALKNT